MNETNANSKVEMDQAPESRDKLICPGAESLLIPRKRNARIAA